MVWEGFQFSRKREPKQCSVCHFVNLARIESSASGGPRGCEKHKSHTVHHFSTLFCCLLTPSQTLGVSGARAGVRRGPDRLTNHAQARHLGNSRFQSVGLQHVPSTMERNMHRHNVRTRFRSKIDSKSAPSVDRRMEFLSWMRNCEHLFYQSSEKHRFW